MSLAAALLLADARTPAGGYAHSFGLEAAVTDGLRPADVPSFLTARARTVALTEAALTAAAAGAGADLSSLARLDDEALARTPSALLRAATSTLGRSLLRTGAQLFPDCPTIPAYRASSAATPRPVAAGVVAAAAGLDPESAALVALHEDAAAVAAAAVKLLPIDAGAASGWVAAGAVERQRLAATAAAAARAGRLPSLSAPLIELRASRHAHDQRRLFAS